MNDCHLNFATELSPREAALPAAPRSRVQHPRLALGTCSYNIYNHLAARSADSLPHHERDSPGTGAFQPHVCIQNVYASLCARKIHCTGEVRSDHGEQPPRRLVGASQCVQRALSCAAVQQSTVAQLIQPLEVLLSHLLRRTSVCID